MTTILTPRPRRRRRRWSSDFATRLTLAATVAVLIGAIALLAVATSRGADISKPGQDVFSKATDYARAPAAIALLPAVSFDHNAESEREVGAAWAASFSRGGYRWISAINTRQMLTGDPVGDSLLTRARASILSVARIDSTIAPAICAKLRVQALLGVRIDQWDNRAIEDGEAGKPWSRVHLRATMVDSLGRVLWTASGSETMEGPEHVPSGRAEIGRETSTPHSEFSTGEGAPPPYHDVLMRILTRWSAAFPPRVAPTPAPR